MIARAVHDGMAGGFDGRKGRVCIAGFWFSISVGLDLSQLSGTGNLRGNLLERSIRCDRG